MRASATWLTAACVGLAPACAPSAAALRRDLSRELAAAEPPAATTGTTAARVAALLAAPLDLDRAAELALLGHPDLAVELARLDGGAAGLAGAVPSGPRAYAGWHGGDVASVGVEQDLTSVLVALYARAAAGGRLEAGVQLAVARGLAIARAARHAFVTYVAAVQVAALRWRAVSAADAAATLVSSLRAAGNVTELRAMRALLAVETARDAAAAADVAVSTARAALSVALGVGPADADYVVAGELAPPEAAEVPSPDALERRALAASRTLRGLAASVDGAAEDVGAARLASLPSLSVGVVAERHDAASPWELGPTVGVSLPIWDLGAGRRRAAWAALRAGVATLDAEALALRAHARAAATNLVSARDQWQRQQTVVLPMHQAVLDEAVKQYNAMTMTPMELIDLRRDELEARVREVELRAAYWRARIDVDALMAGGPVGEARPSMPAPGAPAPSSASSAGGHGGGGH
jgi:outer membrane protein TolC